MRRAVLRSAAVAVAIVAVALGLMIVPNGPAAVRAFAPKPVHAPDLAPLLDAGPAVQIHLVTILAALAVTAVLMIGVKGTRLHRTLGWAWAVTMLGTAVSTLFINAPPIGPSFHGIGVLHLFALVTFLSVPRAVLAARRHDVARHARIISGFVIGGLGVAGLAAFLPGRLLWAVFFG